MAATATRSIGAVRDISRSRVSPSRSAPRKTTNGMSLAGPDLCNRLGGKEAWAPNAGLMARVPANGRRFRRKRRPSAIRNASPGLLGDKIETIRPAASYRVGGGG